MTEPTKIKSLDEYEQIALDEYGIDSHAVRWIQAQKRNKGTLDMSHESMLKMLERMHEKTTTKQTVQLPEANAEVTKPRPPQESMFARLKKKK